jgi:CRISPR-associated protein Cmr2
MVETEDPAGLAAQVRQAGRDRLFEAAEKLDNLRGTSYDQNRFQRQLEGFLEFYCAWSPHTDDTRYAVDRQSSELLFLARKSLNNFSPHVGAAGVPKSSLDGARESVIQHRGKYLFQSNLKDNEYLDAIGLVKRFTRTPNRSLRFESTLDVAAIPYRLGLDRAAEKDPQCAQARDKYLQFLSAHELSRETSSLLYEHESRQIFDKDEAEDAELTRLRKAVHEAHREPNPPYYALLVADGDRMGAAIDEIKDRELHQQFSRRLSEFATEASKLIDTDPFKGCPIYVGGDDVMALLPLHQAIECVLKLRELFQTKMQGPWPSQPTFSAGLAVVHALEPLTEAREIAQRAERAAKSDSQGGRNALAIIVAPRSGPETLAFGRFDTFPDLLLRIIKYYQAKSLSLGFAHELRNLLERTPPEVDLIIVEMARATAVKKQEDKAAVELLESVSSREELANLCRAMLIARPFYRAKKEAVL